jgi:ABC-type nitrate/sulfonate/bicarbonate transport system permease component
VAGFSSKMLRSFLLPVAGVTAALLLTEYLQRGGYFPITIPAPTQIWSALLADPRGVGLALAETTANAVRGFAIGAVVALGLSLVAALLGTLRPAIYNVGVGLSSIPLIATTPLLAMWLGSGPLARSLIAALASYFPILVGAMQGFRNYQTTHRELFHVYSASRWRVFRFLILPSSLPYLFVGLKLAAPLAVLGSLTAELTGAENGIGVLMFNALLSLDTRQVWLMVLISCALSGAGYGFWAFIERIAVYWDSPANLDTSGTPTTALQSFLRTFVMFIVVTGGLVALWQLLIVAFKIPPYLLPTPVAVGKAFISSRDILVAHAAFTLRSAFLGLIISCFFAISLAVFFVTSKTAAQVLMPLVMVFRSAPVIAVAPLIMLFAGRGIATSIVVVVIVSFFPIMMNMIRGLLSADPGALELLRVYGASRWQHIRHVQAPYSLPFLFTGLRIAAASAVLGAMLSEWVTGAPGLGLLILDSGTMREIEVLWAAVITAVFFALIVFYVTSTAEKAFLYWKGAGE